MCERRHVYLDPAILGRTWVSETRTAPLHAGVNLLCFTYNWMCGGKKPNPQHGKFDLIFLCVGACPPSCGANRMLIPNCQNCVANHSSPSSIPFPFQTSSASPQLISCVYPTTGYRVPIPRLNYTTPRTHLAAEKSAKSKWKWIYDIHIYISTPQPT